MGIIELLIKLASGVGLVVCANYFLQTGQLDAYSKVHLTLYLLPIIRSFFYKDMSYNQHTKSILSYTIPIKFDVIGKNG